MDNNKLICPVKRINNSTIDFKVDLQDDKMNVKVDINTKNPLKTLMDFINNKFKEKD